MNILCFLDSSESSPSDTEYRSDHESKTESEKPESETESEPESEGLVFPEYRSLEKSAGHFGLILSGKDVLQLGIKRTHLQTKGSRVRNEALKADLYISYSKILSLMDGIMNRRSVPKETMEQINTARKEIEKTVFLFLTLNPEFQVDLFVRFIGKPAGEINEFFENIGVGITLESIRDYYDLNAEAFFEESPET